MRVYDVNLTNTSAAGSARTTESQKADRASNGQSSASGSAGASDRVEFSSALGSLSRALASSDSARAERVQALATQYQSGNYWPDSMATSRAMVSEAAAAGAPS
jgi:anti-sigma28 factor (negative regulator of flagellin synthesis)